MDRNIIRNLISRSFSLNYIELLQDIVKCRMSNYLLYIHQNPPLVSISLKQDIKYSVQTFVKSLKFLSILPKSIVKPVIPFHQPGMLYLNHLFWLVLRSRQVLRTFCLRYSPLTLLPNKSSSICSVELLLYQLMKEFAVVLLYMLNYLTLSTVGTTTSFIFISLWLFSDFVISQCICYTQIFQLDT